VPTRLKITPLSCSSRSASEEEPLGDEAEKAPDQETPDTKPDRHRDAKSRNQTEIVFATLDLTGHQIVDAGDPPLLDSVLHRLPPS
jgi:hypothetical protein